MGYTPEWDQLVAEYEALMLADLDSNVRNAERNVEAFRKMEAAGIKVERHVWGLTWATVRVEKGQLAAVRRALGRWDDIHRFPDHYAEDGKAVRVRLTWHKYPHLNVEFGDQLKEGGRCQIEEVQRTEKVLVCR